jgi:drug/metabolite transporter (DMT)-like permease
LSLAC